MAVHSLPPCGKYRVRADARDVLPENVCFWTISQSPALIYAQVLEALHPRQNPASCGRLALTGPHAVITLALLKGWTWAGHPTRPDGSEFAGVGGGVRGRYGYRRKLSSGPVEYSDLDAMDALRSCSGSVPGKV